MLKISTTYKSKQLTPIFVYDIIILIELITMGGGGLNMGTRPVNVPRPTLVYA